MFYLILPIVGVGLSLLVGLNDSMDCARFKTCSLAAKILILYL